MSDPNTMNSSDTLQTTPFQQMLSSCTGAFLTSFLVTPLDVVKIRLQAQQKAMVSRRCYLFCNGLMDHLCQCYPANGSKNMWNHSPVYFNGTLDALVKISQSEGIKSLWSGLSPTLVLAVPATVIYFVSYEQLKLKFQDYCSNKNAENLPTSHPIWIPPVAGSFARTIAATIVSPLELIRTKMQSVRLSYAEIGEVVQTLIKYSGIGGLWRGLLPTLMRDVPFSAIYWSGYETFKSLGPPIPSFTTSFLSGAAAGSIAAVVTLPFDVIKTHQQIELGEKELYTDKPKKASPMTVIVKKIVQQDGFKGLFTGLAPRLLRVAPACAIMISSFEQGKKFFHRYSLYKNKKILPDINKDSSQKHIVPEIKTHSSDML